MKGGPSVTIGMAGEVVLFSFLSEISLWETSFQVDSRYLVLSASDCPS